MSSSKYYVYIYLDPRKPGPFTYGEYTFNYEPFYVGKGKDGRCNDHLIEAKSDQIDISFDNPFKIRKIRKILKSNLKPIILKVKENLIEQDSFDLEIWLIWVIGRVNLKNGPLVNLTDGGDGCVGFVWTSRLKCKQSKIIKTYFNNNSHAKIKLSKKIKQKWQDKNYKIRLIQSHKGYSPTKETKDKHSQNMINIWKDDSFKKKMNKIHSSDEHKKKLSESHIGQKGYWSGKKMNIDAWNKGLTKENNDKIKQIADKKRGRTKYNHPGVASAASKKIGKRRSNETKKKIRESVLIYYELKRCHNGI